MSVSNFAIVRQLDILTVFTKQTALAQFLAVFFCGVKTKKWHTACNGFSFKEAIICHVPFSRNGSFRFHSITNHLLPLRAPV
uniref:hypothetical protein n=1 Tax=Alloprevotella sp. TaxID=1872471 RepID=UPI0040298D19